LPPGKTGLFCPKNDQKSKNGTMKTPLLRALRTAFQLAQLANQRPDATPEALLQHPNPAWGSSRRKFLRSGAQAGLLLGLGGSGLAADLLLADSRRYERVAIVGAGMAGLSAGYHLRRKGVKATLFEGDKRPGGRIKSARIFGEGQLNTEIGAEFIDTVHQDMLWFVRALNLQDKLMDVETDHFGRRDAFFIEGRHYGLPELLQELQAAYPRIQADQARLEGRGAALLDRMSMAEYIEGLPVGKWLKMLLHAAYIGENGLETAEQSAANLLGVFEIRNQNFYPFGNSDERFKVIGGNEQVPQGLAKALDGQIRYEHRLTALRENNNRSISLIFNENGSTREETFDLVILTLPFTVLRDVDIQMELPEAKRSAIRELGYGTNAKFILETRTRSWRQAGYRGYLFNERIHNGWDSAQMQLNNEGPGTFTCYYGGERGKNAARGTENEQLAHILPALEGAFPGTSASLTGKMELAHWAANPFARGSYSCFKPGQVERFDGVAFAPVRRLYFAGEHCSSDYWGFMNGAAETGRRAAEKVLRKMRVF
jgi:monoamine oxidase